MDVSDRGVFFYWWLSIFFFLLLPSCAKKQQVISTEERRAVDSVIRLQKGCDELEALQKKWEDEGNQLGSLSVLREWGKKLRDESRFDEALKVHSKGLMLAEQLNDTLEMVQALNNIGTNYRRLGVLDVATEYHYKAWKLSEEHSDTSYMAKKNEVISLNGLGNIYMTLGNYERADSAFRKALRGEEILKSTIGKAINYANIGAVFELQGQVDSAWVYYRRSMELNQKANNTLGISLCYIYFGHLYEESEDYLSANEAYRAAYQLMVASKDEWHALNTLIAMARISYKMGQFDQAEAYLVQARQTAQKINSIAHLSDIYDLYFLMYKKRGDYRKALEYHERATFYADSVVDVKKMNQIQNVSVSLERNRERQKMRLAEQEYKEERTVRRVGFAISFMVILILLLLLSMMWYISRSRARNHRLLKKLNSMRESFFTNVTHEFRTPLTLILGESKDLQTKCHTRPEIEHSAQVIERQGNNLLQLINQLLDISKVKSSVGDPDWRRGDVCTYLSMIVDSYREYAHRHSIELDFVAHESIEIDFVPDYTSKLINNLLSNALKFTPEQGKITVSVWKKEQSCFLVVADTGIGIAEEDIEHLFEPFFQIVGRHDNTGTGIGLALVKQIVDSVGGSISVESVLGKGTTFTIQLPIHHGSGHHAIFSYEEHHNMPLLPKEVVETTDDCSEEDDGKTRVLIIEDNSDIASYIGSRFGDEYAISYVANGRLGIEKAEETIPDIIITDLMMPEMDGVEVCRHIRHSELTNHIPIIVITAKVNEEDRINVLKEGADAFLEKPFNDEELRVRVDKLLEQRRLLREKYAQPLEESGEEPDALEIEENKKFLSKMITCIYVLMESGQMDIPMLAERLCLSTRQLHRKVTALTGETPASYTMHVRMRRAKQLLEMHPEWSVREVALKCGFDEPSNFTRNFRKLYGISPKQYGRHEE